MDDTSNSTKERITLLRSLHRPLEEHWAGNKKVDAVGSDYTYKHHITRLQKVYTSHGVHPQIDLGPPTGPANVSPQTQLFGRGGIAPELTPGQINRREKGWDKYHGHISMLPKSYGRVSDIQEKRVPPVFPRARSRSRSPSRKEGHHRPSSAGPREASKATGKKRKGKGHKKVQQTRDHSMCLDSSLTREQLVIMGLYRFETEDEYATYDKFVQMLARFDAVDKLKIIQDAYSDSQQASKLSAFSGTNVISEE